MMDMANSIVGPEHVSQLRSAVIGVACRDAEKETAVEFFELFKIPWEFLKAGIPYSIVLSTDSCPPPTAARWVVLYSSQVLAFDEEYKTSPGAPVKNSRLDCGGPVLPLLGDAVPFRSEAPPLLNMAGTGQAAGVAVRQGQQTILRIGYDLFREVQMLLSGGQSAENAEIPSLEMHISLLRHWILGAGFPFVEIPPVPSGYDFMCCLTHDVDFAGIRRHGLDRAVMGFLWRATVGSLTDILRGRSSTKKLLANWKAALTLPAVWLGLKDDFWIQFRQYLELEGALASTFFFIPFKKKAGKDPSGQTRTMRATKYDIDDIKPHIAHLADRGCEIGLHGLEAWHDARQGVVEAQRITSASGEPCRGVRMHWLYFDSGSANSLDEAGFLYDSTLGYNDAAGYRCGTAQAFRPAGARDLLELPLHIQDSALFYRRRMGLKEAEALDLCRRLIESNQAHGGVLIVNWHHRSLAPERLWADFYRALISLVQQHRVWFGTGTDVVQWFKKRRMFEFRLRRDLTSHDGTYPLEIDSIARDSTPALVLRVHRPGDYRSGVGGDSVEEIVLGGSSVEALAGEDR